MVSEDVLKNGIIEFIKSGKLSEEKKLYRAAVSNYFKALTELCDLILLRKIKHTPTNHTERFQLLKDQNYEIYSVVDGLFKSYTDTYSKYSNEKICKRIKDGIKKVAEIEGLSQEFKEIFNEI